MPKPRNCATCFFWEPNRRNAGGNQKPALCLVDSPKIDGNGVGTWPLTKWSDFCGRFWPNKKPPHFGPATLTQQLGASVPGQIVRTVGGALGGIVGVDGQVAMIRDAKTVEIVGTIFAPPGTGAIFHPQPVTVTIHVDDEEADQEPG